MRECVGNSAAEALERQKKSGEWEREYGQLSEQQIHFLLREEKGFPGKWQKFRIRLTAFLPGKTAG